MNLNMKAKAKFAFEGIIANIVQYRKRYGVSYEEIVSNIQSELRKSENYPVILQSSINQYLNEDEGVYKP